MKKKAQFYLIMVIVIASLFLGIITIKNSANKENKLSIDDLGKEISVEKIKLLDYIAYNNLTEDDINSVFTNFTKLYIKKAGENKNIFFIFGEQNSINFIGNSFDNSSIQYDIGSGFENLTEEGFFNIPLIPISNKFVLKFGDVEYTFDLYEGQNIYYWMEYNYNKEIHILHG